MTTPTAIGPLSLNAQRDHVKMRVLHLMRSLGSGGLEVLSRRDVNDLIWWLTRLATMGAADLASFSSVENDMRQRFGSRTLSSATTDGEHRNGRERRAHWRPVAIVAPAAHTVTGPNVVVFRTHPNLVLGGNGPRAA